MDVWSFVDGAWKEGEIASASVRWFDLCGTDSARELEELGARFKLHHLSVEDCLSPRVHAPKIDEFHDHLFLVAHAMLPGPEGPEPEELDVFLGNDFLITYQDRRIPAVTLATAAIAQGVTTRPGPDGMLYEVLDRAVDATLPEINTLGDKLDELEFQLLSGHAQPEQNRFVLQVRFKAGQIRRLLTPELAVVQRLSRGEFHQVAEGNRIYFRDIYDHLVRIDLALEELREDADVALTTYLSAVSNRMSEVMKVLSVVSALALPAVVIAGIFGTNFDNAPGLHSNWGFTVMIGSMLGLAGGMALFFKRRGWF